MAEILGREQPLKKTGRRSRASKLKKAGREVAADERARLRYLLAARVRSLHQERPELSIRDITALLEQEVADGAFPGTKKPPSRSQVHNWMRLPADQELQAYSFRDKPRSGRPAAPWHPVVEEEFERLCLAQIHPSVESLHRDLDVFAEAHGVDCPKPEAVRYRYDHLDLAELSAARHGRKSGRADGVVKSTIPVDFPHEIWTLDELDSPGWSKAAHPISHRLESVRPSVTLVMDCYSRAILNVLVSRPYKDGATTVGFDTEDTLASFFGSVFQEVAAEPFKQFSGFLPCAVRIDRATQHNELKLRLRKEQIDAHDLETGAPWIRGLVEAGVKTFKAMCAEMKIRGLASVVLPADRVKEPQEKLRTEAAATSLRVRRKAIVPVDRLPTLAELQEDLLAVAAAYNARVHRMLGVAPEVAYHNDLQQGRLRGAVDALLMLPPVTLTVGGHGIEHRNEKFAARVGSGSLAKGEHVVCRPVPGGKGLFAYVNQTPYFLPTLKEWARTQTGSGVLEEQRSATADYSDMAEVALRDVVGSTIAPPNPESAAGDETITAPDPDKIVSKARSKRTRKAKQEAPANRPNADVAVADAPTPAPAALEQPRRVANSDEVAPTPPLPPGVVRSRREHLRIVK